MTEARFLEGRTFDEYLTYIGTPENLAREIVGGAGARLDRSAELRAAYDALELNGDQDAVLRWLAAQPDAPTRIAEALGAELRIFARDGDRFSASDAPSLLGAPDGNADLMAPLLTEKRGQQWQSITILAFFTSEMRYLYHYAEMPFVFDKDRIVTNSDAVFHDDPKAWTALLASPFFRVWQSAAVDEMVSALHRVALLGQA